MTPASTESPLRSINENRPEATMRFHGKVWELFSPSQLLERFEQWSIAAYGPRFRQPLSYVMKDGSLLVTLPPLPAGYLPFTELHQQKFPVQTVLKVLAALCDALAVLHRRQFHMGFLIPQQLYFHPETLQVLLDIQPYNSAFPFVKHGLEEYPFHLLSRYARQFSMPRVADTCAIGLLARELISNEQMDESLRFLTYRLMEAPESFLFAEEISHHLLQESGGETLTKIRPSLPPEPAAWLHPMAPPLSQWRQNYLRAFLQGKGNRMVCLISDDAAARLDVYHQHCNEMLESDFFITLNCRDVPFATIRELIDKTYTAAIRFFGTETTQLQALQRKLNRIFQQHYVTKDIVHTLASWLYQFYQALLPMLSWQPLYFVFAGCEHCDEDSQRVLHHFFLQYGDSVTDMYAIFSGKEPPGLLPADMMRLLPVGEKDVALYHRAILSQLGRADRSLVRELAEWAYQQQIDLQYCHLLLSQLIERGHITLTVDGWERGPGFCVSELSFRIKDKLRERILGLEEQDLQLLRTFSCLPVPVRAADMFASNSLDQDRLEQALVRLGKTKIVPIYQPNGVCIPREVADIVLHQLPPKDQRHHYREALILYFRFRPKSIPALIELARMAEEKRLHYLWLIRYFRQIRRSLRLEGRRQMLEELKLLHESLYRPPICCWDRELIRICLRLNQFQKTEALIRSLYGRTNEKRDLLTLSRVLLFTNQMDPGLLKDELSLLIQDDAQDLSIRARGAELLSAVESFTPLYREGAAALDTFYREDFYPRREEVSGRLFAELTITIIMVLHQYYPERSEWTAALRKKLESLLESSVHHDLMIDLSNSYLFDRNIQLSRNYNLRQLDMSQRYGFTAKMQISHLNGMELAICFGDLKGYEHHKERAPLVDEIRRADLLDHYDITQLLYACEWQDSSHFTRQEAIMSARSVSEWTQTQLEAYRCYLAFRRKQAMPIPPVWEQETEWSLFVDALYHASAGRVEEAISLFSRCIQLNGPSLLAGWSYREAIALLLPVDVSQAGHWIDRFEQLVKDYGYYLFGPDCYRAKADWCLAQGQGHAQQAMLFLRRAANGYRQLEKQKEASQVLDQLTEIIQPDYLPAEALCNPAPFVKDLLAERMQLLEQSLDLQIVIQVSEQVTEALELTITIQRLCQALFEYFPISRLAISFDLADRQEQMHVNATGRLSNEELGRFQPADQAYSFPLYERNGHSIVLDVIFPDVTQTNLSRMEHFLSFIRPHIANTLLYREMAVDELTGFYQRRYFMNELTCEFSLANAYGLGLSLIMLDIDNFRHINEHGHQEGDRVLRELGELIRGILRQNDLPARYGGEEFLLILPKTDGKEALQLARQLRQLVEESFANRPYPVTVSVGVATLEHCQAESVDDLIRHADNAEITAKKSGKNRVVAAWQPMKAPASPILI